jgi:biopolymer transport protein ExbD
MGRNQVARKLMRRYRKPGELLLVPMIDIFTVLVTFLLMTAVFSRTVVMELNLPTANAEQKPVPDQLVLEVLLRKTMVQVADRSTGPLATFGRTAPDAPYDLAGVSEYLQRVKAKFPEKTDVTVLLEPDIPYNDLVQVMDAVRVVEQKQGNQLVQAELFPSVSLGDAPEADAPAGGRP